MSNKKNRLKSFNEHLYNVKLQELQKLIPTAVELKELLKNFKAESVSEVEFKLNEKTGFKNAEMSAKAMAQDKQYSRLIELEGILKGKLSIHNLTPLNELKSSFKEQLKENFSTYYTEDEFKAVQELEKIKRDYNNAMNKYLKLPVEIQRLYSLNGGYLVKNPFASLFNL